jgi:hypothetical protein
VMVVMLSSVCYVTLPLHPVLYSDQSTFCITAVLMLDTRQR